MPQRIVVTHGAMVYPCVQGMASMGYESSRKMLESFFTKTLTKLRSKMESEMKAKHFLSQKAFVFNRSQKTETGPEGCTYDAVLGAWIWGSEVLVKSNASFRPMPTTKKHDIETGEDQKGE